MLNPSPLLRRAGRGDAPAIERLYRQLVQHEKLCVSPTRVAALADDPHTLLLVGEVAGVVQATALLCLCQDVMFDSQPFAVLENLVVDEAARGQGVGAALMAHLKQLCLAHDCSKLMLQSTSTRRDAHRFFERSGCHGDLKRGFVKYRRDFAPTARRLKVFTATDLSELDKDGYPIAKD